MRDILVSLVFLAFMLAAFRRPFYGALLWVLFGLMNPHRLTYGFAYTLPFAQMAVVVVVLAAAFHARELRWPRAAPVWWLLAFITWMALTTTTALVPGPSWNKFQEVLKVLGMTIVVATLIRTREHIIALVWVMVGSLGYFGTKGGVFTILTGGAHRVWGPPNSLVFGNNELAVGLVMIIPLMYFLSRHVNEARDFWLVSRIPPRLLRNGLYFSMLMCAASAIGSQSRGAFVAIAAMCATLWWRSHNKISIGLLVLVGVFFALPFMPDAWFERMETIRSYEADLSAMARLNAWATAIEIAKDRVMGAGFATANPTVFGLYAPKSGPEWIFVAHSIYFQVLGEHGWIGLTLYLLLWFTTYRMAGQLVRVGATRADFAWLATLGNMAKVSLVGYAVGGAFLSLAYWDMPFYVMVVVVSARLWANGELARPAAAGATAPAAPMRPTAAPGR